MDDSNYMFSVFAEAEESEYPLMLTNLTLPRLFDDIVVPYQTNKPFFIDGAPLTKSKIKKIKILKQKDTFENALFKFNETLTKANANFRKIYGEQYHIRFKAVLRDNTEDVTSQIIKAYDKAIKPRIKDYIPKREELISAGIKVFIESIKLLGST